MAPISCEMLHGADFVVCRHQRNQHGLVGYRPPQLFQIDESLAVHREPGHVESFAGKTLEGIEDGFVLGHRGDQVIATVAERARGPFDRQVVGFAGAAGEDDLSGTRPDQPGDLLARSVNRFLGVPSERMLPARGVAESNGEVRQHRVEHTRIDRRGRVIVEIYPHRLIFRARRQVGASAAREGERRGRICRRRRVHEVGGNLLQRASRERRDDPVLDLPQRVPHAALRVLAAVLVLGRTGGDRQRAVDRLDDVGNRDPGHRPREAIAAPRPLVRGHQMVAGQPLQHFRQQFDRDVVLLRDLTGAGRTMIRPRRQMFHGDQRVISFLR